MSLNRTYIRTFTLPVVFNNVPVNKKIVSKEVNLKATIKSTGWDLLTNNIEKKKVKIDLADYAIKNSINFSNSKFLINENIKNLKIETVVPSFFIVQFEDLFTKRVAIKSNFKTELPPNFFVKKYRYFPDSITISSDKETLKEIEYIEAEIITITENDSIKDQLILKSNPKIKIDKIDITGYFEIEEYSEKEFKLSINIENKPKNVDLVFFPEEVILKCLIPFSDYEKISASDFYISADFNNFELSKNNTLQISIKEQYKNAKNIQLSNELIEYIIYSK